MFATEYWKQYSVLNNFVLLSSLKGTTMTTFINCTPHAISVQIDGVTTTFEPSGILPRVETTPGEVEDIGGFQLRRNVRGGIISLPMREAGVTLIVSGMVLEPALAEGRDDCVAPVSGATQSFATRKATLWL